MIGGKVFQRLWL